MTCASEKVSFLDIKVVQYVTQGEKCHTLNLLGWDVSLLIGPDLLGWEVSLLIGQDTTFTRMGSVLSNRTIYYIY